MSENPYANYPAERGRHADELDDGPSRMSILALGALLLSIPACCVPFLGIGAGPVAAILGVAALVLISKSRGRLGGRGLAATAIFLGIISTVLWGSIGAGAYSAYQWYLKRPVAVTNDFLIALQRGDLTTARASLSTAASNDLTDEQLTEFVAQAKNAYGEYLDAPADPQLWWNAFRDAYTGGKKPQQQHGSSQEPPMPVALRFANRLTVGYSVAEPARLQGGTFAIEDLIIIMPDARGLILRADGPAKIQATVFSAGPVHASELSGAAPAGAEKPEAKEAPEAPEPAEQPEAPKPPA